MARDEVVEAVVVDPRQTVGPLDVLPHPGLEGRLDPGELVLGRFRVGRVEDALLDPILGEDVIDLGQRRVERVHQEFAGVPAGRAPIGRGGRDRRESMDIDRPARDLDRMIDGRLDAEHVVREGGDDIGWDPRRAEAGGDVGGLQVLGQGLFEGRDVAPIAFV